MLEYALFLALILVSATLFRVEQKRMPVRRQTLQEVKPFDCQLPPGISAAAAPCEK